MKNENVKHRTDNIDISVGKKLRIYRNIAGLTQQALAEQCGVTFQQIQKYEKGINKISASRLYKLSKIFKIDVAGFYADLDAPESSENNLNTLLDINDKNAIELLYLYQKINDKALKQSLLNFLKSCIKDSEKE